MPEARDLPLSRWGAELRRARGKRRRVHLAAGFGSAVIALIGFTAIAPSVPRLVWNLSASAPVGLYRVSPRAMPDPGDMVIAWIPPNVRELAAHRRYIPANVPLVKRVAGSRDDLVCAHDEAITINGHRITGRLLEDSVGRPMPWWQGCRLLGKGEYFLLMDEVPNSFDSRYFGPVGSGDIIGKAVPLWVR